MPEANKSKEWIIYTSDDVQKAYDSYKRFSDAYAASGYKDQTLQERSSKMVDEMREMQEAIDNPPWVPLMRAIRSKNLTEVKRLFDEGEVDAARLNKHGVAVLAQPAFLDDTRMMDYLISKGAAVDQTDKAGLTALAHAAMENSKGCMVRLLKAGANAAFKTPEGDTLAELAEYNDAEDTLKILKNEKRMAAFNASAAPGQKKEWTVYTDEDLDAAVAVAKAAGDAYSENPDSVKAFKRYTVLNEKVFEILQAERNPPWKPLLSAVFDENLPEVKRMFDTGEVDAARLNRHKVAVLLQPAYREAPEVLEYLLSKGADPNICNGSGLSALACAVMKDNKDAILTLLKAGADASFKTPEGDTLVQLAKYSDSEEALKILRSRKLMATFQKPAGKQADETTAAPAAVAVRKKKNPTV